VAIETRLQESNTRERWFVRITYVHLQEKVWARALSSLISIENPSYSARMADQTVQPATRKVTSPAAKF
jgi:hypothetical protein